MTSEPLTVWRADASAAFEEIENAHKGVGGTKPGGGLLTQQLNYAYTMLLAARFQGFARSLQAQTAYAIASGAHTPRLRGDAAREPDEQQGAAAS